MAVTIHDSPQKYTPSDNPVMWTFSSDQTAQANFVFLVEVYVDSNLVANELVFPESGIYGKFDASGYASINCEPPVRTQDLITDAQNYTDVYIKVIERYGDPIADGASATASTIWVFKARLDDEDFITWDSTVYDIGAGGSKKWLTNFPGGYAGDTDFPKVKRESEQIRLMTINDSTNLVDFEIQLLNTAGGVVASWTNTLTANTNQISILNLTPSVIIAASPLTQAQFNNSASMTVTVPGDLDLFQIYFNDDCTYDSYKRLHFLSELGTIESYTFGLLSKVSANIKSFGYRRNFGEWNGSSYEFTTEPGRDIDYAKTSDRKMDIESDWLTQDVQQWLVRNLYESPVVWLERFSDGVLQRRGILNTAWMDKYSENDMLFREKVTLKEATKTSMIV